MRSVLGTMGGDAQPQIVLQMMARMLHLNESPGQILTAGRFTWLHPTRSQALIPGPLAARCAFCSRPHVAHWAAGLTERGHVVEVAPHGDLSGFGHAHLIETLPGGTLAGAADPRAKAAAALGR